MAIRAIPHARSARDGGGGSAEGAQENSPHRTRAEAPIRREDPRRTRAILGPMTDASAGGADRRGADHVFDPRALEGAEAAPEEGPERVTEIGLRPSSLDEFVGQNGVVENLRTLYLGAAKGRGEPRPPALLRAAGPRRRAWPASWPRLWERAPLHERPALDKPKDLLGLLTSLKRGDVFFIDEIHRILIGVEEYLYTAMEDFRVEMTLDSGPHARVLPIFVEPFTLVGATTREGLLTGPFRSRFGLVQRLSPYPSTDLERILDRAARILGIGLDPEGARLLAERSRGTPRIAGRFLKRARDWAQMEGASHIDAALASKALAQMGVDERGLEEMDRRILHCLADHAPRAAALKTLAAVVGETEDTIEDVFEPHLLRCGYVQKTPRGRVVTATGLEAIGRDAGALEDGAGTAPLFDA